VPTARILNKDGKRKTIQLFVAKSTKK